MLYSTVIPQDLWRLRTKSWMIEKYNDFQQTLHHFQGYTRIPIQITHGQFRKQANISKERESGAKIDPKNLNLYICLGKGLSLSK